MKNVEEELRELAEPALAKDPSERTYKDRYLIWQYQDYLKEGVRSIDDYDEGEEVEIYDGEALSKGEIKNGFGEDFPDWYKEIGKHFGEKVKVFGEIYTLIGVSYTYVDYYYIFKDGDRKVYESCVGKIEYLG